MKKVEQYVAGFALAAAATFASAQVIEDGGNNGNTDCTKETPGGIVSTGKCGNITINNSPANNLTQSQQQQQQQQAIADARAKAEADAKATATVGNLTAVGKVDQKVDVKTGDTKVDVKTGDTKVDLKTGDTVVKTGDTVVKTGDTVVKTGEVKTGDNLQAININNPVQPVASAIAHAPAIVPNDCERYLSFGYAGQTVLKGKGFSIGVPLGQSSGCSLDKKWNELAKSPNDIDQALKHEIGAEKHPEYRNGLKRIEDNVQIMVDNNNGKDVTVQSGQSHKFLGGAFAKLNIAKQPQYDVRYVQAPAPAAAAAVATTPAAITPPATPLEINVSCLAPVQATPTSIARTATGKTATVSNAANVSCISPAKVTSLVEAARAEGIAEGRKAAVPASPASGPR